jgi:predicted DNA-binding transcriptional regulator AlpA
LLCEDIMRERRATLQQPLPPVRLKPGDRILTQEEAARIRGVTRETLRRMSDDGVGPQRIQLSPGRFGYLASDCLEI